MKEKSGAGSRMFYTICALWNYGVLLAVIPAALYICDRRWLTVWVMEYAAGNFGVKTKIYAYIIGAIIALILESMSEAAVRYTCEEMQQRSLWKRIQMHAISAEVTVILAAAGFYLTELNILSVSFGVTYGGFLLIVACVNLFTVSEMHGGCILQELLGYEGEGELGWKTVKTACSSTRRRTLMDEKKGINGYVQLAGCYVIAVMQSLILLVIIFCIIFI